MIEERDNTELDLPIPSADTKEDIDMMSIYEELFADKDNIAMFKRYTKSIRDDIKSDAFLKLLQKIKKWENEPLGKPQMYAYLKKIIRTSARECTRNFKWEHSIVSNENTDPYFEDVVQSDKYPGLNLWTDNPPDHSDTNAIRLHCKMLHPQLNTDGSSPFDMMNDDMMKVFSILKEELRQEKNTIFVTRCKGSKTLFIPFHLFALIWLEVNLRAAKYTTTTIWDGDWHIFDDSVWNLYLANFPNSKQKDLDSRRNEANWKITVEHNLYDLQTNVCPCNQLLYNDIVESINRCKNLKEWYDVIHCYLMKFGIDYSVKQFEKDRTKAIDFLSGRRSGNRAKFNKDYRITLAIITNGKCLDYCERGNDQIYCESEF